jgi:hypothetical protein
MHILYVLRLKRQVSQRFFKPFMSRHKEITGTHRSEIHGVIPGGVLSLRDDRSIADC